MPGVDEIGIGPNEYAGFALLDTPKDFCSGSGGIGSGDFFEARKTLPAHRRICALADFGMFGDGGADKSRVDASNGNVGSEKLVMKRFGVTANSELAGAIGTLARGAEES